MEKVKDLEKVILPSKTMLGELKLPKRYIVMPDGSKDEDSYIVIVAKNADVDDLEVGDIVVQYNGGLTAYKDEDITYVIMHRGNIMIAVKPDNFIDPDKVSESIAV